MSEGMFFLIVLYNLSQSLQNFRLYGPKYCRQKSRIRGFEETTRMIFGNRHFLCHCSFFFDNLHQSNNRLYQMYGKKRNIFSGLWRISIQISIPLSNTEDEIRFVLFAKMLMMSLLYRKRLEENLLRRLYAQQSFSETPSLTKTKEGEALYIAAIMSLSISLE